MPAALFDTQQPLIHQRADRAANGVPIDPKPRGKLGLSRESPVRETGFGHVMDETVGNLAQRVTPLVNCRTVTFVCFDGLRFGGGNGFTCGGDER